MSFPHDLSQSTGINWKMHYERSVIADNVNKQIKVNNSYKLFFDSSVKEQVIQNQVQ